MEKRTEFWTLRGAVTYTTARMRIVGGSMGVSTRSVLSIPSDKI